MSPKAITWFRLLALGTFLPCIGCTGVHRDYWAGASGFVKDGGGAPIAGALVSICFDIAASEAIDRCEDATVLSGEDGQFALTFGLSGANRPFTLVVEKRGFAKTTMHGVGSASVSVVLVPLSDAGGSAPNHSLNRTCPIARRGSLRSAARGRHAG